MTGTEQPAQILLLTTEMGGSISITNLLGDDTNNRMDSTIQPTISHFKQEAVPGHSDWYHFLIGSLNNGIDVPRSRLNIDNRTEMNSQGPIVTTIPESNISNNCNILDLVRRKSDITYRVSLCHVTIKS